MSQERDQQEPSVSYRIVTSLLLFGLLVEWLLPWINAGEWSTLLHPQALIWMTVIMLVLGLFKPRIFYFISVGVCIGLVGMLLIYKREDQSAYYWFAELIPSIAGNVQDMVNFGIWTMSDEFRTMLLFTGWLLLVPSLQSIVWYYHFSLSLAAATLIYLITLHTTLGIDVWQAMLRTLVEGLLLVAFTTLPKLQRRNLTTSSWGKHARYQYASIVLLVLIVIAGGMAVSSNKEKRSEPIAWSNLFSTDFKEELSVWAQQSSGLPLKNITSSTYREGSVGMAGYGHDDSALGQALRPSDEVVFYGWSAQRSNWRAEIRSTYTGKGWSDQSGAVALHTVADETAASAQLGTGNRGIHLQQTISYIEPQIGMPLMQSGTDGVVLELIADDPERKLSNYIKEPSTGALYSPVKDAQIKSYTVLTELPIIVPEELSEIDEPDKELTQRAWESDMLYSYLQLPQELPERVTALAQEVSGGGITSRYDQVKAIEQYLKENYSYSLKSSLPKAEEDFVDHFLFEQQRGYCVHFATAMVVMLRSQDIPARYVKGYQMGEAVGERTLDDGTVQTQYKVRAQDAHAWVEVYFPNIGWIAFDPTPSEAEREISAAGIGTQLGQLGEQIWDKLNAIGSSLTSLQWQLLGAAGAALLMISILIVRGWRSLKQKLSLARYRRIYRDLMANEQLLELPLSFPSRNKKRLHMQQRAKEALPQLKLQLQVKLEQLVESQLSVLESKQGKEPRALLYSTWRQRLELLITSITTTHAASVQKQYLKDLLRLLEQFYYSESMTPPEPEQLQRVLLGIRGSFKAKANNEKSISAKKLRGRVDHIESELEPSLAEQSTLRA